MIIIIYEEEEREKKTFKLTHLHHGIPEGSHGCLHAAVEVTLHCRNRQADHIHVVVEHEGRFDLDQGDIVGPSSCVVVGMDVELLDHAVLHIGVVRGHGVAHDHGCRPDDHLVLIRVQERAGRRNQYFVVE